MSIIKFRPRDRRQADPFRDTPVTHAPPPEPAADYGTNADYDAEARRKVAALRARVEAEAAAYGPDALIRPAGVPAIAAAYGPDASFGAGRLSPLTAPVEADLGGCVLFRDTVRAHFVRSDHTRGAEPQDGEDWLPEYARIYAERFTGELAGIAERARSAPVPYFAGELAELHAPPGDDADPGPEFDQVAARYEAGFYGARRWFHRADTAGFPAVAS